MNGMATYAVIEDDAEIRCDVGGDGEIEVYLGSFTRAVEALLMTLMRALSWPVRSCASTTNSRSSSA
jgi:hypothetical protein